MKEAGHNSWIWHLSLDFNYVSAKNIKLNHHRWGACMAWVQNIWEYNTGPRGIQLNTTFSTQGYKQPEEIEIKNNVTCLAFKLQCVEAEDQFHILWAERRSAKSCLSSSDCRSAEQLCCEIQDPAHSDCVNGCVSVLFLSFILSVMVKNGYS